MRKLGDPICTIDDRMHLDRRQAETRHIIGQNERQHYLSHAHQKKEKKRKEKGQKKIKKFGSRGCTEEITLFPGRSPTTVEEIPGSTGATALHLHNNCSRCQKLKK